MQSLSASLSRSVPMDWSLSFGRFLGGALISALLAIGGVWFVVDMSLRGMESSVETTNKRIDDLRAEVISHIDLKMQNLELRLLQEFEITRSIIKRADAAPIIQDLAQNNIALTDQDSLNDMTVISLSGEEYRQFFGTAVLSQDGKAVGRARDVVADEQGSVEALIVELGSSDVGATKEVAVSALDQKLLKDDFGNFFFYTDISLDQFAAAHEFDAVTYASNPDGMLLRSD